MCGNDKFCMFFDGGDGCIFNFIVFGDFFVEIQGSTQFYIDVVSCLGGFGNGVDVVYVFNLLFNGMIVVILEVDYNVYVYVTINCN